MKFKSAEEVLKYMVGVLKINLDELSQITKNDPSYEYNCGQKTAFVECMEMIQLWARANEIGLDFDIEKVYPIV